MRPLRLRRGALQLPSRTPGLVNCWISDIREARNQATSELAKMEPEAAVARLCELNVLRQVGAREAARARAGVGGCGCGCIGARVRVCA